MSLIFGFDTTRCSRPLHCLRWIAVGAAFTAAWHLREVLAMHAGRRGEISMTTATAKLNTALITMASQGSRPRCADPIDHQLWTSKDQHDRDIAATWYTGCQVLVLCH
jgi:hypothetical protein